MTAIAKNTSRIVETTIDEEVVVMELDKGEFFSITGTGLAIWNLIDGARSRDDLLAGLMREFEEDEAVMAKDVDEFLGRLGEAGLLEQR